MRLIIILMYFFYYAIFPLCIINFMAHMLNIQSSLIALSGVPLGLFSYVRYWSDMEK